MELNGMIVKAAIATSLALAPCAAGAHALTTLYSFTGGADGASPTAGVINVNGTMYGTTVGGGAAHRGTIFAFDPSTGVETVLHSFGRAPDGDAPYGGVIEHDGKLFGTTQDGGNGAGVVFSEDIDTGAERVFKFEGPHRPQRPFAGVVYQGGILYGVSSRGGTYFGTLFELSAKRGHRPQIIYTFSFQQGAYPMGGLLDTGGVLYGTAAEYGAYRGGAVFSFNPTTAVESVLYSFGADAGDGKYPRAELIYHDGSLYGTTTEGGESNRGTVFKLDPVSGAETVLHSFGERRDGKSPSGGLLYRNGQLYGTTSHGGKANKGTVFKVDAATGAERVLASFGAPGNDGSDPEGTPIYLNGSFYGTTQGGGSSGAGTVFQFQE
jgi:uncharacterized repeat protein (TIGR03803 family)